MANSIIELDAVRALVSAEIFARGRTLARAGAVGVMARRGDTISTEVEGSEPTPYRVTIRLAPSGVADAQCTCPYEWGAHCKHVAAALITVAEQPGAVRERSSVYELLAGLDKTALMDLIKRRGDLDQDFALWVEAELTLSVANNRRRSLVDKTTVKDYARAIVRGRYRPRRHWDDFRTSGSAEELQQLVAKATPFLERGDGRNALKVLEAITDTFVDAWLTDAYGADEEMYLLFDDLARLIAEAALMSDLAMDERDAVAETVEGWHARLSDYGVEEAFSVAIRALQEGWDDPLLQAVLEGKARKWPPADRADHTEQTLNSVRLRVLEACERFDEYLNFSHACGARAERAAMLAKLGSLDEADAYARKTFKTAAEAHHLAKTLRTLAKDDAAMSIAEFGLGLAERRTNGKKTTTLNEVDLDFAAGRAELARWLRDFAGAMGKTEAALKAAIVAFSETHTNEDFRAAERWAKTSGVGNSWARARNTLLTELIAATHAYDRVEILLDEGMIAEAVHAAGETGAHAGGSDTLMRLASAAAGSHSDWVIRVALTHANSIMDGGRSGHYQEAAQWLEKALQAFFAADREEEWRALLERLIELHRRKHKLRPLLEALV